MSALYCILIAAHRGPCISLVLNKYVLDVNSLIEFLQAKSQGNNPGHVDWTTPRDSYSLLKTNQSKKSESKGRVSVCKAGQNLVISSRQS